MKTRLVLTLALSMVMTAGFSQTKRIAHHSHSGADADFTTTVSDNFGISPQMEQQRDSLRKAQQRKADSIKVANYRDSLNKARSRKK